MVPHFGMLLMHFVAHGLLEALSWPPGVRKRSRNAPKKATGGYKMASRMPLEKLKKATVGTVTAKLPPLQKGRPHALPILKASEDGPKRNTATSGTDPCRNHTPEHSLIARFACLFPLGGPP